MGTFFTPKQCYQHKTASAMDFLHNNGIMKVNKWPVLSPDLNVIKNIGKMVGGRVDGQNFENMDPPWQFIRREFYAIPGCPKLVSFNSQAYQDSYQDRGLSHQVIIQ